jgi:hypothetical protein
MDVKDDILARRRYSGVLLIYLVTDGRSNRLQPCIVAHRAKFTLVKIKQGEIYLDLDQGEQH